MNDSKTANARVFVLVDDYVPTEVDLHPPKTLYQLTSFVNLSSNVSVDGNGGIGGGSCSITFNDKDFRFFREYPLDKLNTKDFGSSNIQFDEKTLVKNITLSYPEEIILFKELLSKYGEKIPIYKSLGDKLQIKDKETGGTVLIPIISTQNAVYIHYLDRKLVFHSGFTGLITSVGVSHNNNQTPKITISGKTFDRVFDYSYITTGLSNIGDNYRTRFQSLKDADRTKIALTNRLSNKDASQIIVECFDIANKFFVGKEYKQEDKDYRYWKVRKLFGFGEDTQQESIDGTSTRVIGVNEQGIDVGDPTAWINKSWNWDTPLSIKTDFYPGSDVKIPSTGAVSQEEGDWFQVKISKEFVDTDLSKVKPFQNLLRANLQLFTTDKMTIRDVLNVVKKTTFSLMYFDMDGSFKVERPYFDAVFNDKFGELSANITSFSNQSNVLYLRPGPKDYDLKYIISKKDRSYISSTLDDNESGLVTRTTISGKSDWYELDKTVTDVTLTGVSESSPKTIAKYGDRQVQLDSITRPEFLFADNRDEVLTSYAYGMRLLLSSQKRTVAVVLDQRPDLQLNRKMIFLDYAISFLIRRITQTFSPMDNRLVTTVHGFYVRNIGEGLFNPYFYYISKFDTGVEPNEDIFVESNWELKEWENAQIPALNLPNKDISKSVKLTVDDDISKYGLTLDTFKKEINDVISESSNTCTVKQYNENNINLLIFVPEDVKERQKGTSNRAYLLYPNEAEPKKITASATVFNKKLSLANYKLVNELSFGSYRFLGATIKAPYSLDKSLETVALSTSDFYFNQLQVNGDKEWEIVAPNLSGTEKSYTGRKSGKTEPYILPLTAERKIVLFDKFNSSDDFKSSQPDTLLDGIQIIISNSQDLATIIDKLSTGIALDVWIGKVRFTYEEEIKETVPKISGEDYESSTPRKFFRWCYNLLVERGVGLEKKDFSVEKVIKFKAQVPYYKTYPKKFTDAHYKKKVKIGEIDSYGIILGTQALTGLNNDNWKKFSSGDKQLQDAELNQWYDGVNGLYSKYSAVLTNILSSYIELPENSNAEDVGLLQPLNVKQTIGNDKQRKDYPFFLAVGDNVENSSVVTRYGVMAAFYFQILWLASANYRSATFQDIITQHEESIISNVFYNALLLTSGKQLPQTINSSEIYKALNTLSGDPGLKLNPQYIDKMYQLLLVFKMGEDQL